MGATCLKSTKVQDEEIKLFPEADKNNLKPSNEELEYKFIDTLTNIQFPTVDIMKKRIDIEPFKYENKSGLAFLDIRVEDKSIAGEVYYGFWYFTFFIQIGTHLAKKEITKG